MEDGKKISCWPGWEIVQLIGRGSFGAVYEIQKVLPDGKIQKAAMKVISIPKNKSEILELQEQNIPNESITEHYRCEMEDIAREFSTMLDLKGNAHIVYGEELSQIRQEDSPGWDLYLRMELLPDTLKKHMDEPYDEERVIRVAKDICDALSFCEKKGFIHRDIKPDNIFISVTGDYKLGDFGVARFIDGTVSGTLAGTLSFMAPEVYRQEKVNHTLDIYSLGIVLYRMMNNNLSPFLTPAKLIATSSEIDAANMRRLSGTPLPLPANGSEALQQIVLKACAASRQDRYQSAEEMLTALKGLHPDAPTPDEQEILYSQALRMMQKASSPESWLAAAQLFTELGNYRDSASFEQVCYDNAAGSPPPEKEETESAKKPLPRAAIIGAAAAVAAVILTVLLVIFWPHVHKYGKWVTEQEADCIHTGIRVRTCKGCDEREVKESPATGVHRWTEWDSAAAGGQRSCTVCGAVEYWAATAADEHTWSDWTVIREATCAEPGEKTRSCSDCSAKETAAIPMLTTHSWAEATYSEPAVCRICGTTTGKPLQNLMRIPNDSAGGASSDYFWGQTEYTRDQISSIVFSAGETSPSTAWDLSARRDRSILGWVEKNTLFISSPNKISLPASCSRMFYHFRNVTTILWSGWVDTSAVTDMSQMFLMCENLTALDLSEFNTDQVTDMSGMFSMCRNLKSVNLSGLNTVNVRRMSEMFSWCKSLDQLDISNFNTANVTDMSGMFAQMNLTTLNLSGLKTANVSNMSGMFEFCDRLKALDLTGISAANGADLSRMFYGCTQLTELTWPGFKPSASANTADMYTLSPLNR